MKKMFFSICILTIGTMSAAEINNDQNLQSNSQVIENLAEISSPPPPRVEHGFAWADTSSNGTCLTYGTWYNGDNGVSIFVEASQATLFTMGLPSCSGEGNYLV